MCPDCSPPSVRAHRLHLLEHVAVADLGLDHRDATLAHRHLEAEVRHHGRDDGVRREATVLGHPHRADRHDLVAVDLVAVLVDGQHAVGIAVVGDAEVETLLRHES